jgi:acyl-CoA thioester hydrolase
MSGTLVLTTAVLPEWIDYNGHLRDAYYAVAVSSGLDALMDVVGLDAAYRSNTHCTLYSVEMHLHWLKEVKAPAQLELWAHVLDVDAKRLQIGMDVKVTGLPEVVATAETMLVHVNQQPEVKVAAFPLAILTTLQALQQQHAATAWAGPRSRSLQIVRKSA